MMTDTLTDRIAVRELIERYSVALNLRDFEMMHGTFLPDGVWRVDPPFDIQLKGSAIVAGISQMVGAMPFLFQGLMGSFVEIDGDTATAKSSVHELGQRGPDEGGLDSYGIYHDWLVRTGEGWRFAERRFQPLYCDTSAMVGTVIGG
ncbi:MAG: hypothetical protein NVS3B5_00690 [Sphingomicrobium sp.]